MEGIQMAQMLADLSSMNAGEARAAKVLVNANKHLSSEPGSPTGLQPTHDTHHAVTMSSNSDGHLAPPKRPVDMVRSESSDGRTGRNGSPHPYVFHHRRMLTSPPMSRCASTAPSVPGTPRRELEDDDADKAATIMRLYEIRAKLRQHHDNDALGRAREQIAALADKQKAAQQQYHYPHHPHHHHGVTSPDLDDDKNSPHD